MKLHSLAKLFAVSLLLFDAGWFLSGCHSNQQQTASAATAQADQAQADQGPDPAAANLAPVADTSAPAQGSSANPQYNGPQDADEYSDQSQDSPDESYYGVDPVATAADPPPPLPDYDQPPCPGDGYLWTPGYWDYASSTGYYWVPGVWVQAPYVEAVWTPGYWGYSHGHYAFFNGYWGQYVGFYGGVNYGNGYTGVGYQGGYWNGGHFYYNRSANHIDVTVVHNVYTRNVTNVTVVNRVSYNGGSGGIDARPRPAELAALREPHAPPMQTQAQVQRSASTNRAQFDSVNHGRPQEAADARPIAAQPNVRPAAPGNIHNLPMAARPPQVARNEPARNSTPEGGAPEGNHPSPGNRPSGPQAPAQPGRPPAQPNRTQTEPNRPNAPNTPQARPEPGRVAPYRSNPNPGVANRTPPVNRPQPQERPAPPANRPAPSQPKPQVEQPSRPPQTEPNHQAQVRPAPEQSRPAPPANHPAPPENHAAPAKQPAPPHNPPPQGQNKDEHRPQ